MEKMELPINKTLDFTSDSLVLTTVRFPVKWKNISIEMVYQLAIVITTDDKLIIDSVELLEENNLQVDDGDVVEEYDEIENFFNVMKRLGHNYKDEICEMIENFVKESDPRIFMKDFTNLL